MAAITVICVGFFDAKIVDTFAWSGVMGTLILLVAYVLTTIGAIRLVFVQRRMAVPAWQVVIPVLALALLGYTIYRNVLPYPTSGPARFFPVVAGAWILLSASAVLAWPRAAARLGARLTAEEGFARAPEGVTR